MNTENAPASPVNNIKRCNVLGLNIDAMTTCEVIRHVDNAIATKTRLMIAVVNAAKMVNMRRDLQLSEDVRNSDLVLADGMSIVYASRLLTSRLPERVAGIDLMHRIMERGDKQGYRIYCLGAEEKVAKLVQAEFARTYPGAVLVGYRNGYFSIDEEDVVAREISEAAPDVLFVAITSPKKERFMARWGEVLNATVIHGVGGSFDVVAGKVQRAPSSWQKYGLEWLYRVKQEPGRLWKRYLVTNSVFIGLVVKQVILERIFGRPPHE